MFYCYLSFMQNVNNLNINEWLNKLRIIKISGPLNKQQLKIINRYNINNIDEYINKIELLIKNNNLDELNILNNLYIKIKNEELQNEYNNEYYNQIIKIKSTIVKYDTIIIQLLNRYDKYHCDNALNLYIQFKILMNEFNDNINNDLIHDFMLKNMIYGIFNTDILLGIVIIEENRLLNIDDSIDLKVHTFYIQELIIDKNYYNKGYASNLIHYCINYLCPKHIKYITFMTMSSNYSMIRIAEKNNFILQKKHSGDPKHSLLFVKYNT
jgi:hypothetical protein